MQPLSYIKPLVKGCHKAFMPQAWNMSVITQVGFIVNFSALFISNHSKKYMNFKFTLEHKTGTSSKGMQIVNKYVA